MSGIFGGGAKTSKTKEKPLTALNVQNSAAGLPIPLVYGTGRITPNLLWYGDFKAIAHTEKQSSGGKGGGGSAPSSTTYTYTASFIFGLCEGTATAVTKVWIDKTQEAPSKRFSVFLGTRPQTPWSYLTAQHPAQALGYHGIALACASAYDLGDSASLPNHGFEVQGKFLLGGGVLDADPRDIVTDLLTLVPNAPALGTTDLYSAYCRAAGLLLSPVYADRVSAESMLTEIFMLTNTGVYFSEGVLKLVPYGDAPLTGNGATYTPALTPVANLGEDDFLGDNSADPVIVKRNEIADTASSSSDAYNQVSLEYLNRANKYVAEPITREDAAAIDVYGLRPTSITAHPIADSAVAGIVADLILQRYVYVRGQYTFTLGWQWCHLEPTDLVTLTDGDWLTLKPVRIVSIEENESGDLTITAEDAPPGVSSHVVSPVPQVGGYGVDYNVAAGSVAAVCIFEPPFVLAAGTGLEVWAGVSGPAGSTVWGGCHVWVSDDGDAYRLLTTITNPARVGHVAATMSAAATSVAIRLDGQGGQLLPGTAADAAALNTLFYIGGDDPEFIAHEGAVLTGAGAYTLSGLVRGAYGSSIAEHVPGDPFVRLDDALAKSGSLDLERIGSTISFKFQSYNIWGGGVEDLETLTVYTYTIAGLQATGNAVSGLTAVAIPGSAVLTQLSWDASPGAKSYEIDQSGDGITWRRTGETSDTTWADSALFGTATRFRVAAVRALAGTWSSSVFLNVSYTGMWTSDGALMWNVNPATPMWST